VVDELPENLQVLTSNYRMQLSVFHLRQKGVHK
jgi:hypothetical protein